MSNEKQSGNCKNCNSHEKQQIEEMAKVIARRSTAFRNSNVAFMTTATKTAESLYKANYRKQSKGEWIQHQPYHQTDDFYCSLCGAIAPVDCLKEDFYESNFCPNCGASMKGGAE